MKKICMRVDAYPDTGYGHLKRCLVIADSLRERGEVVFFLLGGDPPAAREVQKEGFELRQVSRRMSFSNEANTLDPHDFENVSITILDLAHGSALKDCRGFALYAKEINQRTFTVLIDSFGEQSLRANVSELVCDVLVSPYIGERKSKRQTTYTELLGVDYFVLDKSYLNYRKKEINELAAKVLITCGGSDPTSVSRKILNALKSSVIRRLDIKLVVGSGFSSELKQSLLELADSFPHSVEFVTDLENLSMEMAWCDIAIATSGLTKYELAATGTPAILVSIDQSHDTVNQYFSDKNSVVDLGLIDEVSDEKLVDSIWALLDDVKERKRQSLAGQNLIKGNGVQNFVDEIFKYKNIRRNR